MSVFGIDLGTCYSCVAKCNDKGVIDVKNDLDTGLATIPSVVLYEKGVPVVGRAAKNSMVLKAGECFSFVKREMNKEYLEQELPSGSYGSRKVSPAEIQACILRHLYHNANTVVKNTDREPEVTKAVVTVPAMFNDTEREKTKLAAQMAGIDVLALVQEPTAAAIAYNIRHGETILVFDLGGGTLDVSIVQNNLGNHKVLGVPAGNPQLGGKDWDEALANHVLRKQGISLSSFSRSSKEWARLMKTAEETKQVLTGFNEAEFNTAIPHVEAMITRSEFENVTSPLMEKALEIVDKAIANAGHPIIDRFVLVGGSSRMPMIKRRLQQKYEAEYGRGRRTEDWLVISDPDQAIAKGAAIYAGVLSGLVSRQISIEDKATHSYGFRCWVKETDTLIICNEILSTDPIVINDKRFKYLTSVPNQNVLAIAIYENDRTEYQFNLTDETVLIEKKMPLPPNLPEDTPIHYILNRDINGIIDVHVECQGRELQFKAKEVVSDEIRRQIEETIRKMKAAE